MKDARRSAFQSITALTKNEDDTMKKLLVNALVLGSTIAVAACAADGASRQDETLTQAPYACGPTCLTMVYLFKTGHTEKTPVDICALAEAGNYAPTGATEWSFMTGGAWQLGLNGTQLYNDRESITQALRSGAPVIAAVRPGTFTNVGHYIVLYGIDDANQIGVYDPNSASRSARRWGVVEVLNEVEAMWAYY